MPLLQNSEQTPRCSSLRRKRAGRNLTLCAQKAWEHFMSDRNLENSSLFASLGDDTLTISYSNSIVNQQCVRWECVCEQWVKVQWGVIERESVEIGSYVCFKWVLFMWLSCWNICERNSNLRTIVLDLIVRRCKCGNEHRVWNSCIYAQCFFKWIKSWHLWLTGNSSYLHFWRRKPSSWKLSQHSRHADCISL